MQAALSQDIVPAVREILLHSSEPISLPQICKLLTGALKVPAKRRPELRALLDADPGIFEWPRSRFWNRDPRAIAAAAAIEIASTEPLFERDLLKALAARTGGFKGAPARELIRLLLGEGKLFEHPPWGKKRKLSAARPDPERYRTELEDEIRPVLEKYAALGITPQRVFEQVCQGRLLPATAVPSQIMEALERMEPRKGLVVAVAKLRRAPQLQGASKPDFDAAAVELFRQRRVFLHDHSAPHALSAAERDELIDDGRGKFYVGIAWREPEHDVVFDS